MPAVEQISETLIRNNITRAASDVFKTMLGRELSLKAVVEKGVASWPPHQTSSGPIDTGPQIVGAVGFVGSVNGLLYLYLDLPFARLCTGHMLGMTDRELEEAGDEVINDAIGEITNMTVGSFKNGLCDAGFPCTLTIPSILRGSSFSIEPISSVVRQTYSFECAGHRVVTDILIKIGD
jgi:chemotaxis protein CheX